VITLRRRPFQSRAAAVAPVPEHMLGYTTPDRGCLGDTSPSSSPAIRTLVHRRPPPRGSPRHLLDIEHCPPAIVDFDATHVVQVSHRARVVSAEALNTLWHGCPGVQLAHVSSAGVITPQPPSTLSGRSAAERMALCQEVLGGWWRARAHCHRGSLPARFQDRLRCTGGRPASQDPKRPACGDNLAHDWGTLAAAAMGAVFGSGSTSSLIRCEPQGVGRRWVVPSGSSTCGFDRIGAGAQQDGGGRLQRPAACRRRQAVHHAFHTTLSILRLSRSCGN